jgi:hypothetical protein
MRAHEFIPEKINPETIKPGFEITRRMKNGLVIRARGDSIPEEESDYLGVKIQIYDPKDDPELRWSIADARFRARQDPNTGEWYMYSVSTGTKERYRRQGLASAMYNFARMLGNDLKPSRLQTQAGEDFWKQGGAGAGRPLELSDEPEYKIEPPPPPKPPPAPPPQPRGFMQRWKRLLMPDKEVTA